MTNLCLENHKHFQLLFNCNQSLYRTESNAAIRFPIILHYPLISYPTSINVSLVEGLSRIFRISLTDWSICTFKDSNSICKKKPKINFGNNKDQLTLYSIATKAFIGQHLMSEIILVGGLFRHRSCQKFHEFCYI